VGTLGYMSPEQARGEPVTTASDMYSCGLLLQEISPAARPTSPGSTGPLSWHGPPRARPCP
jgi:serine/threonine-protein kinase